MPPAGAGAGAGAGVSAAATRTTPTGARGQIRGILRSDAGEGAWTFAVAAAVVAAAVLEPPRSRLRVFLPLRAAGAAAARQGIRPTPRCLRARRILLPRTHSTWPSDPRSSGSGSGLPPRGRRGQIPGVFLPRWTLPSERSNRSPLLQWTYMRAGDGTRDEANVNEFALGPRRVHVYPSSCPRPDETSKLETPRPHSKPASRVVSQVSTQAGCSYRRPIPHAHTRKRPHTTTQHL